MSTFEISNFTVINATVLHHTNSTCNSLSWFAEFTFIISEGEVVIIDGRESEREIETMATGRLVFIHSTDRLNNLSSATRRQKELVKIYSKVESLNDKIYY